MEGALARLVGIGMGRIEAEQLAPVLEHEAGAGRHQPAAHAAIVRLDQADHHPIAIDHGEICGVAFALQFRLAGTEFRHGTRRIDEGETFASIFFA